MKNKKPDICTRPVSNIEMEFRLLSVSRGLITHGPLSEGAVVGEQQQQPSVSEC